MPGTGTNAQRIESIFAGRAPPESVIADATAFYPADPVTTEEQTVYNATDFNTYAGQAGTRITIGSSFTGNIQITADDIDVVMDNSLTIAGRLGVQLSGGSPYISRVRWTGGNIGNIAHAKCHDFLIDDLYATAVDAYMLETQPEHMFCYSNASNRIAIINSTLELAGDPSRPSYQRAWALHPWGAFAYGDTKASGFIVANSLCLTNHQTVRFIGVDDVMIVDSVFNPDGGACPDIEAPYLGLPAGADGNGFRVHQASDRFWVKDSWGVGFMQLNQVGEETNPEILNAYFDNFDRYVNLTYAFFANANTGAVHNSTAYGGTMSYGTLTDGGTNSEESWDGSTVPDYSAVGAVR